MIPRKRKFTAAFVEIARERDTLRRSWRAGEHSDWILALGPCEYSIHRVIVATGERASAFLAAAFRDHCSNAKRERTDLTELVPTTCWPYFEALLDYVYDADLKITVDSWGPIVKMADLLQIGALYTRCVEVGNELLTPETAPKLVGDAVDLQLGGLLQQEVVQIAVDTMVPMFSSYKASDLTVLPLEVFQSLLRRDDLEIKDEDQVFDFLVRLEALLTKADMLKLWKCCRFFALSAEKSLEANAVSAIPKEALVWALALRGLPGSLSPPMPATSGLTEWVDLSAAKPRGRQIVFFVQNPQGYAAKRHLRSRSHQLCERFRWRLLIFPLGTESTGSPRQVAAFVELIPAPLGVASQPPVGAPVVDHCWHFKGVKYSITLVNWFDERRNVTKEHVFDFSSTEVDNGWHRGWVTPENMTESQGWLNDAGELCFRAHIDIRGSELIEQGVE